VSVKIRESISREFLNTNFRGFGQNSRKSRVPARESWYAKSITLFRMIFFYFTLTSTGSVVSLQQDLMSFARRLLAIAIRVVRHVVDPTNLLCVRRTGLWHHSIAIALDAIGEPVLVVDTRLTRRTLHVFAFLYKFRSVMFTDLLWIASLAFRWRIVSFQKCPRVQKCPKSIIKTNILLP